jgi:DNA transformation protein
MKTPLKKLKNLGPTIIKRLNEIEIYTKEDLGRVGSFKAYIYIKKNYPKKTIPICYYLYSLEGALRGIHWNDLPKKTKQDLLNNINK